MSPARHRRALLRWAMRLTESVQTRFLPDMTADIPPPALPAPSWTGRRSWPCRRWQWLLLAFLWTTGVRAQAPDAGTTATAARADTLDASGSEGGDRGSDARTSAQVPDPAGAGTPAVGRREPEPLPLHVVRYREEESPLVYRVAAAGRDARARAREATLALASALDRMEDTNQSRAVTVQTEDGVAVVRVGSYLVTTYYVQDAVAEGVSLENFSEQLEDRLRAFVTAQLKRQAIQLFVLHVFLSVFFGVVGFLTLRFLRAAFDRWDSSLVSRRGSLQPISILRIPVISGEALGGSLAFGLAVGRVSAYVVALLASIGAILGQFDATRPLLARLVSWSTGPILRGVEIVVRAVPGVVLAAALLVALRAALRVLHLLLDGVSSKRIVWQRLPPARVPVFRVVASAAAILVAGPLLVGAAFGRFGTPLETLALYLGGATLLASVPALTSVAVGATVLWRGVIRPGDWVQIGEASGEVTHLSLSEVSLVPEGGGTIGIPMLYLLLRPLRRLREAPAVSFEVNVRKEKPAREVHQVITLAVRAVEPEARVECVDMGQQWLRMRISAPALRDGVRQQLLFAVSDAVDRAELALAERAPPMAGEAT